jgi:glyoxylase-like metal-dependent hydrolase (beta-lactamase superfamily II)
MAIHYINSLTCNARFPKNWKTGLLSLLIETDHGLVLVDTGLGTEDYANPTWFIQLFRIITHMPFDPDEAAIQQVQQLGYQPTDVRHIVLTHMHFDHCGGLPDFPHAKVHIHRREYEAYTQGSFNPFNLAYVRRHIAHEPEFVLYEEIGEKWHDFDAIRLPFTPDVWLITLPYHSQGHCGIAIQTKNGWLLHCGDAAGDFRKKIPQWAIRLALGPHERKLRAFGDAHPEVKLTASHMFLDFFEE